MIVILGQPTDACATLTEQELRRRGRAVVFADPTASPPTLGLNWAPDDNPADNYLVVESRRIPLGEVTGVLARTRYTVPDDPGLSPEDRAYMASEVHATFVGLLAALPGRVINRPAPGRLYRPVRGGPAVLRGLKAAGWCVPPTLVTSRADQALRFFESCRRQVCVGTVAGPAGPRLVCGADGADTLEGQVAQRPVYLQAVPPGQWLRVWTVGTEAFAAAIDGPAGAGAAAALTPAERDRCRRLAQALRLDHAEILALRAGADELYCYDVSDWPDWGRCPESVRAACAAALARLLEAGP